LGLINFILTLSFLEVFARRGRPPAITVVATGSRARSPTWDLHFSNYGELALHTPCQQRHVRCGVGPRCRALSVVPTTCLAMPTCRLGRRWVVALGTRDGRASGCRFDDQASHGRDPVGHAPLPLGRPLQLVCRQEGKADDRGPGDQRSVPPLDGHRRREHEMGRPIRPRRWRAQGTFCQPCPERPFVAAIFRYRNGPQPSRPSVPSLSSIVSSCVHRRRHRVQGSTMAQEQVQFRADGDQRGPGTALRTGGLVVRRWVQDHSW